MAKTRRLAAIMFTDMVGYTAATQVDERASLALRNEHEELVRPLLAEHEGRRVKSTGDGLLVEFESALKATECAIDIQRRLHARNENPGVTPITLRIGIHLGDVEQQGTDIFGDAVNIAARIEPVAEPEGICLTSSVREQVWNKIHDPLEKLPPRTLKGLKEEFEIYRVVLPWSGRAPAPPVPILHRIAVLPLTNIGPDAKDEYFAEGLTEEMIATLSKIRELRVIARTSVSQYKGTSKTVNQIGEELGVTSVLEGSVRMAGDRLRITLQLIDVRTDEHVWANSFDRQLDDIFAVQSEIAERTADALRIELVEPERRALRKRPTSDLRAYNLYLKGIHAAHQFTTEGTLAAIGLLEEAIQSDPHFGLACSTLANLYLYESGESLPHKEAFRRARELTVQALALDPTSSDSHTARGNLALQEEHDWATAEREFKMAVALNPSNANAHFWYSILLRGLGRFKEQIEELQTTLELDPLWEDPKWRLPLAFVLAGDFESALAMTEEERARDPSSARPILVLASIYIRMGRAPDARKQIESLVEPLSRDSRETRTILLGYLGETAGVRALAAEKEEESRSKYVRPGYLAELYSISGQAEKALACLEDEYRSGTSGLWANQHSIAYDPIRTDPRFVALIEKDNLPSYVK